MIREYVDEDRGGLLSIYPEFFHHYRLTDKTKIFVAEEDGFAGFCLVTMNPEACYFDDVKDWANIDEVHVKGNYRNRGIGGQLINHALDFCRQLGVEAVYIETDDFNLQARGCYEKCGFKEYNKIIRYKKRLI